MSNKNESATSSLAVFGGTSIEGMCAECRGQAKLTAYTKIGVPVVTMFHDQTCPRRQAALRESRLTEQQYRQYERELYGMFV